MPALVGNPLDAIVAETLDDLFDLMAQNLDGLPPDIVVTATQRIQAAFCDSIGKQEWDRRRVVFSGAGAPGQHRDLPRDEPHDPRKDNLLLGAIASGLANNARAHAEIGKVLTETQARLGEVRSRQSATDTEIKKELSRAGLGPTTTELLRKGA